MEHTSRPRHCHGDLQMLSIAPMPLTPPEIRTPSDQEVLDENTPVRRNVLGAASGLGRLRGMAYPVRRAHRGKR